MSRAGPTRSARTRLAGRPGVPVPEVEYRDIKRGSIAEGTRQAIRRAGCAVVRGVFSASVASDWFCRAQRVSQHQQLRACRRESRGSEASTNTFPRLKAGKPQIFNIYWSKPQVMARQDPKLAGTRAFLDRLWTYEGVFDPDNQCTYAEPGASPAARRLRRWACRRTWTPAPSNAGSIPDTRKSTRASSPGIGGRYDPFERDTPVEDARAPTSPAVCSMFRTYQGWTAPTRQGPPRAGRLRLIPIADGISYVLLRAMQDDVAEDDLCGARPGRALGVSPEWHKELMAGMVSIPEVQPGDTVWWHTDICHAVGDEHAGKDSASVIYIGSAPDCVKNRTYLLNQKAAFLAGRSAPDFAAMDFEVDFKGRATEKDLTELGRRQMGF